MENNKLKKPITIWYDDEDYELPLSHIQYIRNYHPNVEYSGLDYNNSLKLIKCLMSGRNYIMLPKVTLN
jgi:hypothetical protein